MVRRVHGIVGLVGVLCWCARPALGLIYLPENSLESLLVRGDAVVIGTVSEIAESANRGVVQVEEVLKGKAGARVAVSGVMLKIDTDKQKARFAKGDRIVLFCGAEKDGVRAVMHSQKLESDAEVKMMRGCIVEVMPVAQVLADLGDPKKKIELEPLHKVLKELVASKNGYTQILVGRLLATRMAGGAGLAGPESWEDVLMPALGSKRMELVKGGLAWAGKYETMPEAVRAAVAKIAAEAEDKANREAAKALLERKVIPSTKP